MSAGELRLCDAPGAKRQGYDGDIACPIVVVVAVVVVAVLLLLPEHINTHDGLPRLASRLVKICVR